MGKSFKRNGDDWDENLENRREKFQKRRNDKKKKQQNHDQALDPVVEEEKDVA